MSTEPPILLASRFRQGALLGAGGSAEVFQGFDVRRSRTVALKRLRTTGLGSADRAEFRRRARREAELASEVEHANVIKLLEVLDTDDATWLVLEFARCSLADRLDENDGRIEPDEVLRIGRGVAAGLVALHDRGLIHRDVKPQNILLDDDGTPKITDFGVASMPNVTTIAPAGSAVGTPSFWAPEVSRGEPATEQSDVYSLAATLRRALVGPHDPRVPPSLPRDGMGAVITDGLARNPQERPTMSDFRSRLDSTARTRATKVELDPPSEATVSPASRSRGRLSPRGLLTTGVVLALALLVLVLSASTADPPAAPSRVPISAPQAPPPAAPPATSGSRVGDRWRTFWSDAWYSPFAVTQWAYDDSVPEDAGMFRGFLWLVRLGVAVVGCMLIDIPLTLAYTTSAMVGALVIGAGPAHALVIPALAGWVVVGLRGLRGLRVRR